MDWVRSCYSTEMGFFTEFPLTSNIRWAFAQPGAETFPGPHLFGSANWRSEKKATWTGIGEVAGASRPYSNGRSAAPLPGDHYCGNAALAFSGEPNPPEPQPQIDALGRPTCCVPGTPTLILWGNPTVQRAPIWFLQSAFPAVQTAAPPASFGAWANTPPLNQLINISNLAGRGVGTLSFRLVATLPTDTPVCMGQYLAGWFPESTVYPASLWQVKTGLRFDDPVSAGTSVMVAVFILDITCTTIKQTVIALSPFPNFGNVGPEVYTQAKPFSVPDISVDATDVLCVEIGVVLRGFNVSTTYAYSLLDGGPTLPGATGQVNATPASNVQYLPGFG
jgi:hypothetical protein